MPTLAAKQPDCRERPALWDAAEPIRCEAGASRHLPPADGGKKYDRCGCGCVFPSGILCCFTKKLNMTVLHIHGAREERAAHLELRG